MSFNKSRLRTIEKILKPKKERQRLKIWTVSSSNEDENSAQIERITRGEIKHPDGGFYSETDANFFIDVRFLPVEPQNGQSEMTANLEDEIRRLELRLKRLRQDVERLEKGAK